MTDNQCSSRVEQGTVTLALGLAAGQGARAAQTNPSGVKDIVVGCSSAESLSERAGRGPMLFAWASVVSSFSVITMFSFHTLFWRFLLQNICDRVTGAVRCSISLT